MYIENSVETVVKRPKALLRLALRLQQSSVVLGCNRCKIKISLRKASVYKALGLQPNILGLMKGRCMYKMYEAGFEKYVCDKIKAVGGRAFKWVCPGVSGAPDRICIFPGGRIIFLELKRPGCKDGMSERQKKICRLLEKLGCDVKRVGDKEEFKKIMEAVGYGV